mmetsp:Transcript_100923/g.323933  ORF Transcript_100923/g.323933 Transcript_100923/m.323933 type:complete len:272 (+) Transcript_100923:1371-2186(+)
MGVGRQPLQLRSLLVVLLGLCPGSATLQSASRQLELPLSRCADLDRSILFVDSSLQAIQASRQRSTLVPLVVHATQGSGKLSMGHIHVFDGAVVVVDLSLQAVHAVHDGRTVLLARLQEARQPLVALRPELQGARLLVVPREHLLDGVVDMCLQLAFAPPQHAPDSVVDLLAHRRTMHGRLALVAVGHGPHGVVDLLPRQVLMHVHLGPELAGKPRMRRGLRHQILLPAPVLEALLKVLKPLHRGRLPLLLRTQRVSQLAGEAVVEHLVVG